MRRPLLLLLLLAACDDPAPRAANACHPDDHGQALTFEAQSAPGPFAVASFGATFVDSTRATPAHEGSTGAPDRTLVTNVWYPAVAEAEGSLAASGGPFPIVMYSHGFSSTNGENPQLAKHLASHGYVVVAPSFPSSNIHAQGGPSSLDVADQPLDVRFVLDQVLLFDASAGHPLEGALDDTRIAAVGLSLGGTTTLLTTYHPTLRDPRIDVAVAFAPVTSMFGPSFYASTNVPLLVLHGDADAIVSYEPNAIDVRDRAQAPVSLLTLARGTHTGFTLISTVFEGQPGYEHIDALGCGALGETAGSNDDPSDYYYTALGGEAAGLVMPTESGAFCPADLGVGMAPSRQLTITDVATLAFLDAYLSADATLRDRSCAFGERALPREADLSLATR